MSRRKIEVTYKLTVEVDHPNECVIVTQINEQTGKSITQVFDFDTWAALRRRLSNEIEE